MAQQCQLHATQGISRSCYCPCCIKRVRFKLKLRDSGISSGSSRPKTGSRNMRSRRRKGAVRFDCAGTTIRIAGAVTGKLKWAAGRGLLPRHGDTDSVLCLDEVIYAFGRIGDRQLNPFDQSVETIADGAVILGDG